MLLNGGELDGVRILSPKSVDLMRADHIGDLPRVGALGPHDGFGLTFRVVREPGLSGAHPFDRLPWSPLRLCQFNDVFAGRENLEYPRERFKQQ